MKKRKLNSQNPKYQTVDTNVKVEKKRILMCNAPTRDISGKKTNVTVPVYGVWYE